MTDASSSVQAGEASASSATSTESNDKVAVGAETWAKRRYECIHHESSAHNRCTHFCTRNNHKGEHCSFFTCPGQEFDAEA